MPDYFLKCGEDTYTPLVKSYYIKIIKQRIMVEVYGIKTNSNEILVIFGFGIDGNKYVLDSKHLNQIYFDNGWFRTVYKMVSDVKLLPLEM